MRLLLTAGFDRARHAVALAELLRRDGHGLALVLVVSPFRVARLRSWVRARGTGALAGAARRLAGGAPAGSLERELEAYLERLGIAERSLSAFGRRHGVPVRSVGGLRGGRAADLARSARVDGVLYAGGGILGRPFLEAVGGRVLNAHSGPLPEVRGMNACEWSLLLGLAPAVSVHWIDEGIDTGAPIERIPLEVRPGDTLESLRARCTILGIEGLRRAVGALAGPLPGRPPNAASSRQCFTLAPVLRELLEARLAARGPAAARPAA